MNLRPLVPHVKKLGGMLATVAIEYDLCKVVSSINS